MAAGRSAPQLFFAPIPAVAFASEGPVIASHAEAQEPFTVAGEHGVLVGQQDGTLEAWVLPVKVLSHLAITAEIAGYGVPIDVNRQAAEIEVRPDRTVITYSHIGFTVRQIMFSPNEAEPNTGPVALFEFDCLKPTEFTFSFTPELKWMWPGRNEGGPGIEWVSGFSDGKEMPGGMGGYYILHSDYPDLAAAVTIPEARPGVMAPYQERPLSHPVELKLEIDPERDKGRIYPLLMAVGMKPAATTKAALGETLKQLSDGLATTCQAHAARWKKMLADLVKIETPDKTLDEAFAWAEISIEQLRARAMPNDELGLVAGYYESGDTARPGFGWFFGRDSLYTIFALNGYGDFALTKAELEFLIRRQRDDGKIMHEYAQTAAAVDWKSFPYLYAAADSTPLFLLAVEDYVRASGDTAFVTAQREAIEKAWTFETTHDADGDGIYDNSQGTGWVESWPGGLPHQEIYLALLDEEASAAMVRVERLLGNAEKASAAEKRAEAIAKTIETEYYDATKGCYAFSRNPDGTRDETRTVYPALAWWRGESTLAHGGECLQQLAGHTLNTDWGLRDLASDEKIYDGMSYHQGSVWPLFTGWAALAEYRGGQPLAGYRMLMENANLTRAQDLGAVTELLSGDFFVPFGRSTSHQMWSSAMVITPALRGLFGIEIDAEKKTITVNPRLPASWDHAEVLNLQLPGETTSLYFKRSADRLEVYMSPAAGDAWKLRTDLVGATIGPLESGRISGQSSKSALTGLRIPTSLLEVDSSFGDLQPIEPVAAVSPGVPPVPGARTEKFRIVDAKYGDRRVTLKVEGLAGSVGIVTLIPRGHVLPKAQPDPAAPDAANISFRGCDADPYSCKKWPLLLQFPAGEGWKTLTVNLIW
jgi:glycogen debranching enzyme